MRFQATGFHPAEIQPIPCSRLANWEGVNDRNEKIIFGAKLIASYYSQHWTSWRHWRTCPLTKMKGYQKLTFYPIVFWWILRAVQNFGIPEWCRGQTLFDMGPPKKECILYWKNKSYFIKNDVGVVVGTIKFPMSRRRMPWRLCGNIECGRRRVVCLCGVWVAWFS